MSLALGAVSGVLLLGGCGLTGSGHDAVSLSVSGGFAGVRHGVEVTSGGDVFLVDGAGDRTQADDLTRTEKEKLDGLLDTVDAVDPPSRAVDDRARDLFEYRLQFDGRTVVTDGSKGLGAVDDLIAHLKEIRSSRL
ncbi:hypothetical protein ACIBL6_21660 [Streptomyces sp. NPDC050400]|uniref:hypothetical protein n=1 Tax=Streptomyces sp. NPDC050400 TaxID=3365610 RepID=UPI0037873ECC